MIRFSQFPFHATQPLLDQQTRERLLDRVLVDRKEIGDSLARRNQVPAAVRIIAELSTSRQIGGGR